MHQFLTVAMTSRSAAKLKAVDQARSKLEELTKYDYPCFTFMLTEEGPELLGEEDLTTELMEIFEERGLIEMAQRIKLRGQALVQRSTRNMRIQRMQEAFSCHLPDGIALLMKNLATSSSTTNLFQVLYQFIGFIILAQHFLLCGFRQSNPCFYPTQTILIYSNQSLTLGDRL